MKKKSRINDLSSAGFTTGKIRNKWTSFDYVATDNSILGRYYQTMLEIPNRDLCEFNGVTLRTIQIDPIFRKFPYLLKSRHDADVLFIRNEDSPTNDDIVGEAKFDRPLLSAKSASIFLESRILRMKINSGILYVKEIEISENGRILGFSVRQSLFQTSRNFAFDLRNASPELICIMMWACLIQ